MLKILSYVSVSHFPPLHSCTCHSSDPDHLSLVPATLTEYWVSGACRPCGDFMYGGVPLPCDSVPAAMDRCLLHLNPKLPWPRAGEESLSLSLQPLVAARLAAPENIRCSTCEAMLGDGFLDQKLGRVDLLLLDRHMDPQVLDSAARRTYCPGRQCYSQGVRAACPGHLPPLKYPNPVARPDPSNPIFPGKEMVAVLGHCGRHDLAGHWVAWVCQGGTWYLADSLGDGSLQAQDPFRVQLGGPDCRAPVTLAMFAFK